MGFTEWDLGLAYIVVGILIGAASMYFLGALPENERANDNGMKLFEMTQSYFQCKIDFQKLSDFVTDDFGTRNGELHQQYLDGFGDGQNSCRIAYDNSPQIISVCRIGDCDCLKKKGGYTAKIPCDGELAGASGCFRWTNYTDAGCG